MINAIISLGLTLAIAVTLGSQITSAAYRASSVRATIAGESSTRVSQTHALSESSTPS